MERSAPTYGQRFLLVLSYGPRILLLLLFFLLMAIEQSVSASYDGLLRLLHLVGLRPGPPMDSKDDRDFADAITAVADLRKINRSTYVDATPSFQPMIGRLTLDGFKNYVLDRYPSRHETSANGKFDLVDIERSELRTYNWAFLNKDRISITFVYSDDWRTVTRFQAALLNGPHL